MIESLQRLQQSQFLRKPRNFPLMITQFRFKASRSLRDDSLVYKFSDIVIANLNPGNKREIAV